MATNDPLQRVTELRALEEKTRGRRAQAESNLALAKGRLEQVEAEIRALGVEPDTAEQELRTLETQLDEAATKLEAALTAELAGCDEVVRITNEALR